MANVNSLFKNSRAALLSVSLLAGGSGAVVAQNADSQVTGVVLSYGSSITGVPEEGSGVWMPAGNVTACKNAGIAHYIISNAGGWAKAAFALCVGKDNKPLQMFSCDDNSCKLYKDYSDKGYHAPSP